MTVKEFISSNQNTNVKWKVNGILIDDINTISDDIMNQTVSNWTVNQLEGVIVLTTSYRDSVEGIVIVTYMDTSLPPNTIALPDDVYSKCVDKTKWFIISRFPICYSNILSLSGFNVVSVQSKRCYLSSDIFIMMGLDVSGDIINLLNIRGK